MSIKRHCSPVATWANTAMAAIVREAAPNQIYAWGSNASGLLGIGDCEDKPTPERVKLSNTTNIKEIDSGGCSTIIVDTDDNVYVAGENIKGLLGLDSTDWKLKVCTFTKIPTLLQRKVIKVSCGWWHALAVADNGASLFGWGWNKYGQLGINAKSNDGIFEGGRLSYNCPKETVILPTEIVCADANEQIYVDVSCGWKHSLLLLSNGIVYSSGSNIHGQLGMDNTTTKCLHSFHKVPTHRTASNDCKLQIINICCGWQHSSALGKIVGHSSSSSTLVLTWGSNKFFQLGRKSKDSVQQALSDYNPGVVKALNDIEICSIRSGWSHMIALCANGFVYSWGRANFGQCGRVDNNSVQSLCHGKGTSPVAKIVSLSSVKCIACGSEHSAAVDVNGALFTWGWNEHGNLGQPGMPLSRIPIPVVAMEKTVHGVECGGAITIAITG